MKTHSIKYKLVLWFSTAVILISSLSVFTTLMVSRSVIRKVARKELVKTVEENLDEIEYYEEFSYLEVKDPYDAYLSYGDGFLEIDDDFVKNVNGINMTLYDDNGLVYGDSSLFSSDNFPEFSDQTTRYIKLESGKYYIYDRRINTDGAELWLRGTAPAQSTISQINGITKLVLMFIPLLVVLAIIGGYLIARKAMKPVVKINDAAESISVGNDLSRRIDIGEGDSELHSIANSFNAMLERLENSFNKERQLTSDISHELRTPISVIYSQCCLSLETDNTKEEFSQSLALIKRQSKKMSSIINDMLSFSRLERGAENISLEKLNLSQCISSVCEDMSLINDKEIKLEYDIKPEVFINGNFELVTRMCVNLISNAYRYGKENGYIKVVLKTNGGSAVLSVKDNGIGISKDNIKKVFDRFYRADESRNSAGTGLGLSFVKEIAEIHSAKIEVESEPGQGSDFKVTFKTLS